MGESVRADEGIVEIDDAAVSPASDAKIRELHANGRLMTFREWATSLGFSHKNPQTWVTKGKLVLGQHYFQLSSGNKTRYIWVEHAAELAARMHGRAGRPPRKVQSATHKEVGHV